MDVTQLQFLFMGIIFVTTTSVGLAPVLLKSTCSSRCRISHSKRKRIISCATCFGAGVFLFVCFMGLLPAADSKFHKIMQDVVSSDASMHAFAEFPWGFFIVTIGFLMIFTIDKLVHAVEHSHRKQLPYEPSSKKLMTDGELKKSPETITSNHEVCPVEVSSSTHLQKSYMHNEGHDVPSSVIFLLALGIHSLFEGMAVGLQDGREKVLEFSVAVLLHEVVMSATFGIEVSKKKSLTRFQKVLYVVLFTVTIPLGIAIGVGLQSTSSTNRQIVAAVFEAFATGIFIHVIFIEILSSEFPHGTQAHLEEEEEEESLRISSKESPSNPVDQTVSDSRKPSELCLIMEKITSICFGLLIMILLNVFMHAHH